ncbi:MAG: hypothetical protein CSA70_09530 [Rhodobacterales bacterium]|nr:MAG: hypothetical protein CSA70_09530 [Rhodobacterales bacterium]
MARSGHIHALTLAAVLMPSTVLADLSCVADRQCRGDAVNMCAPSTLSVRLDGDGWLWIDRQGPYTARKLVLADAIRWELPHFGGNHALELRPDGRFQYTGNRGKRYTGQCTGQYQESAT